MSKKIRISEQIIPKYYDIFNDTSYTHIILTSGRAGTKSSMEAIRESFKVVNDDDCSVVVMRKFHNKLKKTVYKEFLRGIRRLGMDPNRDFKIKQSPMEIKNRRNGNTIYFTGNDSIDDTKGMIDEAKQIKRVIIDEITEFFDKGDGEDELANIEATFIRGNDSEFQMVYMFNPPKNPKAPVMQWLKKMKLRTDVLHIHVDYRDVPEKWLGKKLIEAAELMQKTDKRMYEWLWLGRCIGLDELIYYMFDEKRHVYFQDIPVDEKYEIGEIGIGIDYGQKNPTVFEAFAIDYKYQVLRGIDEYYHCGRKEGQKSPGEYAEDFRKFCIRIEKEYKRVISFVFIDPSAKGLAEEIKRIMPGMRIRDADNKVALGIGRIQKLLSFLKIVLSPRQKMLIEEMGLYEWDEKSVERGKEEPHKENDHCEDATRYLVNGMWQRISRFLPVTERD